MTADKKFKLTDLFNWSNAKLGKTVLTWSIPAVLTCPGRSSVCESLCYADKSFFKMANVRGKHHRNWELSQRNDFHLIASKLLRELKEGTLFRIHVAGDFYDATYTEKWLHILKQNPQLKAWGYTRSWRIDKILPVLEDLSKLDNLSMWFSADKETGQPAQLPKGVRVAYMMTDDSDIPNWKPDLYFRDYAARDSVLKYVNDTLVCPAENGISGHVHCDRCKVCILDPIEHPNKRTHDRAIIELPSITGKRIALTTI